MIFSMMNFQKTEPSFKLDKTILSFLQNKLFTVREKSHLLTIRPVPFEFNITHAYQSAFVAVPFKFLQILTDFNKLPINAIKLVETQIKRFP